MGFTTITTAAVAAEKALEAAASHGQARALRQAAAAQEQSAARQAEQMVNTAAENQRREQRNAQTQTAQARANAAASNLLREGSTLARETDLATRLEDEIAARTGAALNEADNLHLQGTLQAWDTRLQAKAAKHRSFGSLLGAAGSAAEAVGGLFTPAAAPQNKEPR